MMDDKPKHILSESFTPSSCDPIHCVKCGKRIETVEDEESECPANVQRGADSGEAGELVRWLREIFGPSSSMGSHSKVLQACAIIDDLTGQLAAAERACARDRNLAELAHGNCKQAVEQLAAAEDDKKGYEAIIRAYRDRDHREKMLEGHLAAARREWDHKEWPHQIHLRAKTKEELQEKAACLLADTPADIVVAFGKTAQRLAEKQDQKGRGK